MLRLRVCSCMCAIRGDGEQQTPRHQVSQRETAERERESETAASSGVYKRWSHSNGGYIFPNTGLLL